MRTQPILHFASHNWPWALGIVACLTLASIGDRVRRTTPVGEMPDGASRLAFYRWLWARKMWWFLRDLPPLDFATTLWIGLKGHGKSAAGCETAVSFMRAGGRVYSNIYLRDVWSGRTAQRVSSWLDVLRVSVELVEEVEERAAADLPLVPALIFVDEIHRMCDARMWQHTPLWWTDFMAQIRHFGIGICGTTQHPSQVEKRLRMLVETCIEVTPHPLRGWWRRLPLFVEATHDLELADDPGSWLPPGKPKTVWRMAHALYGYSSWEILAGADMGDMSDQAVLAEVAELTERARKLRAVGYLPALTDSLQSDEAA